MQALAGLSNLSSMMNLNKLKAVATGEQESNSLLHSVDEATTLSWRQRLIGFACCFALGLVLCIISIPMLWSGHIGKFAIFYSFGSIVSLCSTMFLMGPLNQIKKMFDRERVLATLSLLVCIGATLFVAFQFRNGALALIFLLLQMAALIWYSFTWIPGGVTFLKTVISGAT